MECREANVLWSSSKLCDTSLELPPSRYLYCGNEKCLLVALRVWLVSWVEFVHGLGNNFLEQSTFNVISVTSFEVLIWEEIQHCINFEKRGRTLNWNFHFIVRLAHWLLKEFNTIVLVSTLCFKTLHTGPFDRTTQHYQWVPKQECTHDETTARSWLHTTSMRPIIITGSTKNDTYSLMMDTCYPKHVGGTTMVH
jgi:hypothetical protein